MDFFNNNRVLEPNIKYRKVNEGYVTNVWEFGTILIVYTANKYDYLCRGYTDKMIYDNINDEIIPVKIYLDAKDCYSNDWKKHIKSKEEKRKKYDILYNNTKNAREPKGNQFPMK